MSKPKSEIPKPRLLVVDDEEGLRTLLEAVFTAEGFAVDVAAGGEEAFRLALRREYAVVLMDMMLPGMNGMEAIRAIEMARPGQKFVIVTAYRDVGDVRRFSAGHRRIPVMEKPFKIDELVALMKKENRRRSAVSRRRKADN